MVINLTPKPYFSAKIGQAWIYIVCVYVQCTDILFRYKVWVSPRLAHAHVPPTFTPHTKGKQKHRWGRRRSRRPHRYFCLRARSARAPLCAVWMLAARVCALALGSLTLYTWIICLCIAHIYTINKSTLGQFGLKNMVSGSNLANRYAF